MIIVEVAKISSLSFFFLFSFSFSFFLFNLSQSIPCQALSALGSWRPVATTWPSVTLCAPSRRLLTNQAPAACNWCGEKKEKYMVLYKQERKKERECVRERKREKGKITGKKKTWKNEFPPPPPPPILDRI